MIDKSVSQSLSPLQYKSDFIKVYTTYLKNENDFNVAYD